MLDLVPLLEVPLVDIDESVMQFLALVLGTREYRLGEAGDLGHVDAERVRASLFLELVQIHKLVLCWVQLESHGAGLNHRVLFVFLCQLMVVGGEEGPALDPLCQVVHHGISNREAVVGGSTPAQFVQDC
jgi:hypothetical protein